MRVTGECAEVKEKKKFAKQATFSSMTALQMCAFKSEQHDEDYSRTSPFGILSTCNCAFACVILSG